MSLGRYSAYGRVRQSPFTSKRISSDSVRFRQISSDSVKFRQISSDFVRLRRVSSGQVFDRVRQPLVVRWHVVHVGRYTCVQPALQTLHGDFNGVLVVETFLQGERVGVGGVVAGGDAGDCGG